MIRDYCQISMDDLIFNQNLEMDIFVRLHEGKYVRVAKEGELIDINRRVRYREKGVQHFYVRREDFRKILDFNLVLSKAITASPAVAIEKKKKFLALTSEVILENTFVIGFDRAAFLDTKDFLMTCMELLTEDAQIFSLLEALEAHTDHLYAHSLGVSMYSVMLARALGWTTTSNLFKLGFGALVHDIGKTKFPTALINKPKSELSFAERLKMESHTLKGKEILSAVKSCPSESIAIVYEHHESCNEDGYPRKLKGPQIHPMARIVAIADEFCNYALKSPSSPGNSAHKAFHLVEQYKKHQLDEEFFFVFKSLMKKPPKQSAS